MAELKTRPTDAPVDAFIAAVEPEERRQDCQTVMDIMARATGESPRMWGPSIVGYGTYSYSNQAGKNFEWMITGFSPRKAALTLYIMAGFDGHEALMSGLGHHKTGKSCLYIKRLSDVDLTVLEELVARSVTYMRSKYETL